MRDAAAASAAATSAGNGAVFTLIKIALLVQVIYEVSLNHEDRFPGRTLPAVGLRWWETKGFVIYGNYERDV